MSDREITAAYVRFSHLPVARTKAIGTDGDCNVDFDAKGRVVGIECLSPIEVKVDGPVGVIINRDGVAFAQPVEVTHAPPQ